MRNLFCLLALITLLSACAPKDGDTFVTFNNTVSTSTTFTITDVSGNQSQYYGQLNGPVGLSTMKFVMSASADITVTSFIVQLNAGGNLSFSEPSLGDMSGNVSSQVQSISHLTYLITLDSPLTLRAGESRIFNIIVEVTADPGLTGVIQASIIDADVVSNGQLQDFSQEIVGPLILVEGAPAQVEIENLPISGQFLNDGQNELLRVRITALEDVVLHGLNVTLFKNSGIDVQSIQVVDSNGSDLGSITIPFQNGNENVLGASVLFNAPIQLQAGQTLELEYRANLSFTNSNLFIQAVLYSVTGAVTRSPVVGTVKES